MDWISFTIAGVMVYLAIAIFIGGTAFRIYQWMTIPRSGVRLGLFPRANSRKGRLLQLGKDTFIFPQVRDVDKVMWIAVLGLHAALVAAFVGHMRLLTEFTPLANSLGSAGMDRFALISGGTIGIVLMISLLYLLMRRFKSPYKDISTPEDYALLVLVLLVVLMGNHLRFFGDVHAAEYREYVHSLFTLSPTFPAALAASATRWSLVAHVFFANLLLIYLPFSKLVHFAGSFAVNLVRSE